MIVGHGLYHEYSYTSPVGSPVTIYGIDSLGKVNVGLSPSAYTILGSGDVEIVDWCDFTKTEIKCYNSLANCCHCLNEHGDTVPGFCGFPTILSEHCAITEVVI